MFESFRAGSDDGRLQSSDGVVLESGGIGEIADHASGRGRQTRVRIDVQEEALGSVCHGWWPERLRRLPGNRTVEETVGAKAHVTCPLQIVQYLSQVQRSSGKSHCAQRSDLA